MPQAKTKAKTTDTNTSNVNKLAPFAYHGLNTKTVKGGQVVTDCLLCGKPSHFFINPKTGQWDCKVCGEKGNTYTFLRKLVERYREDTSNKALHRLARLRELPYKEFADVLAHSHIVVDALGFLVPTVSPKGKIQNVHTYHKDPKADKYVLHSTAGMSQQLFVPCVPLSEVESLAWYPLTDPLHKTWPLYIVEGHWDALALEAWRKKLGLSFDIMAVPGASTFKEEWIPYIEGRKEVYIPFDNDSGGQQNMLRMAEICKEARVQSIKTIAWPTGLKPGYDLNNYISQHWKGKQGWNQFQSLLLPYSAIPTTRQRKTKPPTFSSLTREFRKNLHLTKQMEETWAVCLSVAISNKLRGDPLWIYVVGPPSSGKTVMLRSMELSEKCNFQSTLTPKAFISGWGKQGEEDSSLLPRIVGRTLIVKDYTVITQMPESERRELQSLLRDAYDGTCSKTFGNGLSREYKNCQFSMLAAVTDVINDDIHGSLGERFLRVEFLSPEHDSTAQLQKAIFTTVNNEAAQKEAQTIAALRELTADFLDNSLPDRMPTIPKWVQDRLLPLVQVIAYLRTEVLKDHKGNPLFRPRPEIGSRLAKQILNLGQCLALVLGKKSVDAAVFAIMKRVAFDTVTGWQRDVFLTLANNQPKLYSLDDIVEESGIGKSIVYRCVMDMNLVGTVHYEKLPRTNKNKGRRVHGYQLSPKLQSLWKAAKL